MRAAKHYVLILLMMNVLCPKAQSQYSRIKQLYALDKRDTLKEGYSIIYGSFMHRKRFSDRYERYDEVRLQDTVTGENFAFSMLPDNFKVNFYMMAFYIKPGVYFLTDYYYAERRLIPKSDKSSYEAAYYGQFRGSKKEAIVRSTLVNDSIPSKHYILVIKENSVNFIGNWNFNDMDPPFKNKKEKLDDLMEFHFPRLDLKKANIALPY